MQHTLYRYFRSEQPGRQAPRSTFHHLPYDIRRRIYLYAGLLYNSRICLNYMDSSTEQSPLAYDGIDPEYWPTEERIIAKSQSLSPFLDGPVPSPKIHLNRCCVVDTCLETEWDSCTCEALPSQLLYVSTIISEEVLSIFYSENHFIVYQRALGGLSCLQSLHFSALSRMKSLSIALNISDSQSRPHFVIPDQCVDRHGICDSRHGTPVRLAKSHHLRPLVKEWKQTCQLLTSHIQPNHLNLSIICDVADFESADEIARLVSQLPVLRECGIGFGPPMFYDLETNLQQLARQTVDKVTGRSTEYTFRYMDLPREIQLRILEYTELVTPFDLVWSFGTYAGRDLRSPFYEYRLILDGHIIVILSAVSSAPIYQGSVCAGQEARPLLRLAPVGKCQFRSS